MRGPRSIWGRAALPQVREFSNLTGFQLKHRLLRPDGVCAVTPTAALHTRDLTVSMIKGANSFHHKSVSQRWRHSLKQKYVRRDAAGCLEKPHADFQKVKRVLDHSSAILREARPKHHVQQVQGCGVTDHHHARTLGVWGPECVSDTPSRPHKTSLVSQIHEKVSSISKIPDNDKVMRSQDRKHI